MKKEVKLSKAEIKKAWLKIILGLLFFGTIIPYGIYGNKKQEQMFKERGVVSTMTIYRVSIGYLSYEYYVNGKIYFGADRYKANIEYNIGDKYKIVYDPLDPETHELIQDKEKEPIPSDGKEIYQKYTDFKQ